MYPKDTEKWKQFTTEVYSQRFVLWLFCIPKILKNESNSQHFASKSLIAQSCFVSQRYWKMKAIHNNNEMEKLNNSVVLYPKDTEKWKQFTTQYVLSLFCRQLFCIPKILKNESNSQLFSLSNSIEDSCFVSQRYWKMKAIHNNKNKSYIWIIVVLYPKDTEKWKQFTTQKKKEQIL